jgi:hypothetical protein
MPSLWRCSTPPVQPPPTVCWSRTNPTLHLVEICARPTAAGVIGEAHFTCRATAYAADADRVGTRDAITIRAARFRAGVARAINVGRAAAEEVGPAGSAAVFAVRLARTAGTTWETCERWGTDTLTTALTIGAQGVRFTRRAARGAEVRLLVLEGQMAGILSCETRKHIGLAEWKKWLTGEIPKRSSGPPGCGHRDGQGLNPANATSWAVVSRQGTTH